MIDAFQHSCQSARQNLEEFQKLKNESENNQTEDELHNDTSVWNSTAESVEIEKVVEQVLDQTEEPDQTLEPEPDETIESEEEKETPVSAEVESSELDLLVMKSAITAEDIEEESIVNRPGKFHTLRVVMAQCFYCKKSLFLNDWTKWFCFEM